jgi:hypothetical protein
MSAVNDVDVAILCVATVYSQPQMLVIPLITLVRLALAKRIMEPSMKKSFWGGILLLTAAWFSNADVLALKEGHPQTYVVQKGDTLWGISGKFLEAPWQWPDLWQVNPQIENPHLIYPGDELHLVYVDGKPRIVLKRGGDVKLSPQVRLSSLEQAIQTIPLDTIGPWLSDSRVVQPEVLVNAPYVIGGTNEKLITGAGDQVLARGNLPADQKVFDIFRNGEAYADPETGENLGVHAKYIGTAKLGDVQNGVATLALNRAAEEVRRADRLLPQDTRAITANYFPSAPKGDVRGHILAVENGVTQIGAMNVVIINKGIREGLEPGNILAIYKGGRPIFDPVAKENILTPEYRAGMMMVFRTFDKVSYAIVLKASENLAVGDKLRAP